MTPEEGTPFLSVTIAALRGSVDNVQYTHFECPVSGKKAQEIVRQLKSAVEGKLKVLIGFTLSDLYAESFTFKNGDKAGETGVSLKARLLRVCVGQGRRPAVLYGARERCVNPQPAG